MDEWIIQQPKVRLASKFERQVDRRTFVDKKGLYDGVSVQPLTHNKAKTKPKRKQKKNKKTNKAKTKHKPKKPEIIVIEQSDKSSSRSSSSRSRSSNNMQNKCIWFGLSNHQRLTSAEQSIVN